MCVTIIKMVFRRKYGRKIFRPGFNSWKRNLNRRLSRRGFKKISWSRRPRRAVQSFNPLGKSYIAKLKYFQTVTIDPSTGTIGDYVFSANGCYDPDITGTGTQPYGFDQMMLFYNHYTVIGSKCTATMVNNTTLPIFLCVALRDSATTYSGDTLDPTMMEPGIVKKMSGGQNFANVGDPTIVSKSFSARKFFGKDVSIIPDYQGTTAANPAEQAYFHVMLGPNAPADNIPGQVVHVEIEFIVRLTEPKVLLPS